MGETASILGLLATGTSAVATGVHAYGQARAIEGQADAHARQLQIDAGMSKLQAEDAARRGEAAAAQQGLKTRRLIGEQRALAAAAGVAPDTGSALDLQAETAALGAMDAVTIRNNAALEALGFRGQGQKESAAARWVRMQGKARAGDTLLTGGLRAFRTANYGLANYYPRSTAPKADAGLGEEDPNNP